MNSRASRPSWVAALLFAPAFALANAAPSPQVMGARDGDSTEVRAVRQLWESYVASKDGRFFTSAGPARLQRSAPMASCRPSGLNEIAACTTVDVPERREVSGGRVIHLHVMILRPRSADTANDPIVVLPGGPGEPAIGGARGWSALVGDARAHRSVILVDPRGTGESGAIECVLDGNTGRMSDYFHDFLPLDRVDACRGELSRRADLRAYTTEAIADDLEAVRQALGYRQLNLFGISGGSRQAQIYLARYPSRVRSLVLAGVIGPGFHMPLGYARDSQDAFDSVAAACQRGPVCHLRFSDVRGDLARALARLDQQPARVRLPSEAPGDSAVITRDIFAEGIRRALYTVGGAAGIPRVVHHAAAGDYMPFVESVLPGGRAQPAGAVAMGHFLSVTCSEDVDRIAEPDVGREIAHTFLRDYRIRQQRAACARWPHARLPEEHFRQARSNVPALLITGGADPVTGPRWAQALRSVLPNSTSLVFPNGGHAPVANPCAIAAIVTFLEAADPKRVSSECAARLPRPPFDP